MVFQITRRDIWFKIKDLHGKVTPKESSELEFCEQAKEALFNLLETDKGTVDPELWKKIDHFLLGFVKNVKRCVLVLHYIICTHTFKILHEFIHIMLHTSTIYDKMSTARRDAHQQRQRSDKFVAIFSAMNSFCLLY